MSGTSVIALVLILALTPAPTGAAGIAQGEVRVVSESPRYFEALLEVPSPVLVPTRLGDKEAVRLVIPGWTSGAPEGSPLLPVRTISIAVPEGERVRIDVEGQEPTVIRGLTLIPFWGGLIEDPSPRAVPLEAASDAAYGSDSFQPEILGRVGEPAYLRDLRLVPIDVTPAQYNPARGELVLYRTLRIRVEAIDDGAGALESGIRGGSRIDAGGWERIYRAAAINYPSEMASRAMRNRSPVRLMGPGDEFNRADRWLAVEVSERGIYRITYDDIIGAGMPQEELAGLDTAAFRLFNGGGLALDPNVSVFDLPQWMPECALLVEDGGDGSLGPGEGLVFYGHGTEGWSDYLTGGGEWGDHVQNLHTAENVYWLALGGDFGGDPPLRMGVIDGEPGGGVAQEPGGYKDRVHVERNTEWDGDHLWSPRARGVRWERWWWQILRMADMGGRFYRVTLEDVLEDQPCRLKARFWGLSLIYGCLSEHMLSVSFNGSDPFLIEKRVYSRMDVDTTAVWAVEGRNELVARVPFVEDTCLTKQGKTRIDESYFAWFELEYYRRFVARDGVLAFDWINQAPGEVKFVTRGFADGPVRVFDVTDRNEPALITGAHSSVDTVTFQVSYDGTRSDFLMVSGPAVGSPDRIEMRSPGALGTRTEPVDYIIVTGGDLEGAADVLADWRRGHLYGVTDDGGRAYVEVVDVEDIYDEYSWGLVDPVAIKNFLEFRFKSAPAGQRPPSYALMFGEATWDFRDIDGQGVSNIVPSFDEGYDKQLRRRFSSDDFFVLFEGPGDPFDPPGDIYMDMAVGRLTPGDATEAMDLVTEKIIGFEASPDPGPWRAVVLLAADDECVPGGPGGSQPEGRGLHHTEEADDLAKRHIPRAFDRRKIYTYEYGEPGCVELTKPEARRDFIDAISSGALLINYVGHGSPQKLSDEELFLQDDVSTLENRGRLGLVVTASCAVANFDQPLERGLAEGLVRNPGRGALGTYGATTLAYITPNRELNGWIVEAMLPRLAPGDSVDAGPGTTLGLGVAEAEARFSSWTNWVTPYKYVLLGDPASVLSVPGTPYGRSGSFLHLDLEIAGGGLKGGVRDTLRGKVMEGGSLAAGFNGTADVLVEGAEVWMTLGDPEDDYEPYVKGRPTFYHGRADVTGGEFNISWVNPYELRTGDGGRIRAYAWNERENALGALTNLAVTAPSGAPSDNVGPEIDLAFEGGSRVVAPGSILTVKVSDPSGINLAPLLAENSLFLRLYNDDLGEIEDGPVDLTPVFTYEKGSSSSGTATYRLPDGLSTSDRTNAHRIEVSASDNYSNMSTAKILFEVVDSSELKLTDVINHPNPFSASTTIGFRVMKEADVVVKIYTVSGRHVVTLRSPGVMGWGQVVWDGADEAGEPVANGVYLYKVSAVATEDRAEKATFVGKAVVMR